MIDFVTVYDATGKVLWISRTDPVLGITQDQIIGQNIFSFSKPGDDAAINGFAHALLKRKPITFTATAEHNGAHRSYHTTFHPVPVEGQSAIVGHSIPIPQIHLSPREIEIAVLIAQDFSTREIAKRLDVAQSTIDSHRSAICAKLGGCGIAGITMFCVRHGLAFP